MTKGENKIGTMLSLFAVLVFGILVVVLLSLKGGNGNEKDLAVSKPATPSYASLGGENKKESTLSDVELGADEVSRFILGYVPSVVLPKPEPIYEDDFIWGTFSEPYLGETTEQVFEEESETEEEIVPSDWIPPSDKEVFDRLFPAYYIDGLSYYQDLLINTGYFKEEERLNFDDLDSVIEGLDKGLAYALNEGYITQEKHDMFRKGIYGEFKDLIMYEWEQLKNENGPYDMNKIKQGAFNVKDFWPPRLVALSIQSSCGEEDGIFKKLWRQVIGFFSPDSAYAGGGCGFDTFGGVCIEYVECYRSGPPVPGGVNLWAPCCCCCFGKTPVGCLNSVCTGPRAAIWDPMTGICGCG